MSQYSKKLNYEVSVDNLTYSTKKQRVIHKVIHKMIENMKFCG